jgi:alcohol dehydrogenase (NADP+)
MKYYQLNQESEKEDMKAPSIKLNNNYSIPSLGLGTWQSEKGKVGKAVEHALLTGYRHIDCAAIYGNETEIGQVFNSTFSSKKIKR